VVPLREQLAFGLVFSIIFQELFRFFIYALLSKADAVLKKLTENEQTRIFENKHILAYGTSNYYKIFF
jgi:anterior pharynx defective protein 1